jgi:echinoderm microtubule-associated protein-like 6
LASVGEDDFHSVAVWDWASKKMLSNAKVDPDKVFDICWKDDTEFATVGMKHVKFFTLAGANLSPNKGLYGTGGAKATICCHYAF